MWQIIQLHINTGSSHDLIRQMMLSSWSKLSKILTITHQCTDDHQLIVILILNTSHPVVSSVFSCSETNHSYASQWLLAGDVFVCSWTWDYHGFWGVSVWQDYLVLSLRPIMDWVPICTHSLLQLWGGGTETIMCSVPCTRAALLVHHCTAKREDGSQALVLSGEKKMIMSDMHQQNIKKKAVRSICVKRVKIWRYIWQRQIYPYIY